MLSLGMLAARAFSIARRKLESWHRGIRTAAVAGGGHDEPGALAEDLRLASRPPRPCGVLDVRGVGVACHGSGALPRSHGALALGELEAASRAAPPVLLALFHAAVTSEQPVLSEHFEVGRVRFLERTRQSKLNSAGLSGQAAAVHVDEDVVGLAGFQ